MKKYLIGVAIGIIPFLCVLCGAIGYFAYQSLTDKDETEETEETEETTSTTDTTEETDTTTTTTTTQAPDTQDPDTFHNEDYNFSFKLDNKDKYNEVNNTNDWSADHFTYCYTLNNQTAPAYDDCGKGKVGVFSIVVYNKSQYNEFKNSMYGDTYPVLGTKNDLYFVLNWPNGTLPSELGVVQNIYDQVEMTFEVE